MPDLSFWLHFTKMKLDVWKLENPRVKITGSISLANNANMPADLEITEQSFTNTEK